MNIFRKTPKTLEYYEELIAAKQGRFDEIRHQMCSLQSYPTKFALEAQDLAAEISSLKVVIARMKEKK